MIRLPKPDFGLREVVNDLTSDDSRVESIRAGIASLEAHEQTFERLGDTAELHTLSASVLPIGDELANNLVWAYKVHLRDGQARRRYNSLRGAVARFHKKCPLCLVGRARPLDHYLPKAYFGSLAITPLNLVPICDYCNTKKGSKYAAQPDLQPLHPYFDDFAAAAWLIADVVNDGSPVLEFGVLPAPDWSETEAKRVRNHFDDLDLQERYLDEAMAALSGLLGLLEGHREIGGPAAVRAELLRQAASERLQPLNAWRAAALEGWARSDWFVTDGVRELRTAQEALIHGMQ